MVTACWTLEIGDKEHIKRVKKKEAWPGVNLI